tara:strand:- start:54 stop:290 length:237 start_codon:yes stop_codon:yes gene_type:complete
VIPILCVHLPELLFQDSHILARIHGPHLFELSIAACNQLALLNCQRRVGFSKGTVSRLSYDRFWKRQLQSHSALSWWV